MSQEPLLEDFAYKADKNSIVSPQDESFRQGRTTQSKSKSILGDLLDQEKIRTCKSTQDFTQDITFKTMARKLNNHIIVHFFYNYDKGKHYNFELIIQDNHSCKEIAIYALQAFYKSVLTDTGKSIPVIAAKKNGQPKSDYPPLDYNQNLAETGLIHVCLCYKKLDKKRKEEMQEIHDTKDIPQIDNKLEQIEEESNEEDQPQQKKNCCRRFLELFRTKQIKKDQKINEKSLDTIKAGVISSSPAQV